MNLKRALATVASAAVLLSIGINPTAQAATKTISIWTFGDVIEPALVLQYKKIHPDITLQIKKADLAAMNGTDMTAACTSGTGPDIVAVEVAYSGKWRSYPQCFTDLRNMRTTDANADASNGTDKNGNPVKVSYVDSTGKTVLVGSVPAGQSANTIKPNFLGWRWAQGVAHNGAVIGIPTDVGGLEVLYRSDLMVKAGIVTSAQVKNGTARDVISKKWPTWSKFLEVGKQYMSKLSAADKKAGKGFMDNSGAIFNAMMNQGSTKYYKDNGSDAGTIYGINPKTKKKEPIYSWNPQVKLAWDTTIAALKANIGTRTAPYSADWGVGMNTGKFAVLLAPAWMMDYVKQQAPGTKGKWDIASLPGGGGNIGGTQLGITSYSKNKQDSWDFLAWYLAPEQQLQVFRTYGLFPSTKVIYDDASVLNYKDPFFNNAPVGKIYTQGILKLKPIFEGELNPVIDTAFGNGLGRVATGKKTAAQSWTMTMAELKTLTRNAK